MTLWPQQRMQEVAEGILAVCHGQGEGGVANAVCVFEQGRALVVDTMTLPAMTEGLVQAVARRNARVSVVLNTHHHIDHTGGNRVFAGVPIIAHPATRRELERMASLPVAFYERLLPQFRGQFTAIEIQVPDTTPEQFVLPQEGEILAFRAAHSPADLTVWFARQRVLLAGDLSFIGVTPLVAHGLFSGWLHALDSLIALRPAVVVPGHGPVGGVQDLVDLRTYLRSVLAMGQRVVAEQLPLEEALKTLDSGPVSTWIEARRTELNLKRAIVEVRGEIDPDNLVVLKLPAGLQASAAVQGS